ncbi:hypothetical protein EJ110_NYTH02705 [Nymphaea thermarum]|nr:hypothetical protein EJ110_NYTH02705 [Nymphaea thermarum]
MVGRLKNVLAKLIRMDQGAFLVKQVIQVQILLYHGLLNILQQYKGRSLPMKLGISKAYDRVHYWGFLQYSLNSGICYGDQWTPMSIFWFGKGYALGKPFVTISFYSKVINKIFSY